MLLALVSPERASVLWELNIRYLKKQPDGVVFTLIKPPKSGDSMSRAKATFPRFLQDTTLCPCDCLETYLKKPPRNFVCLKTVINFSCLFNDHITLLRKLLLRDGYVMYL